MLQNIDPFIPVSISEKVVFNVILDTEIPTAINFYIQYLDPHTLQTASSNVTGGFTDTTTILFEDRAPFQRFKVSVALMSGDIIGPLFSQPTRIYGMYTHPCTHMHTHTHTQAHTHTHTQITIVHKCT